MTGKLSFLVARPWFAAVSLLVACFGAIARADDKPDAKKPDEKPVAQAEGEFRPNVEYGAAGETKLLLDLALPAGTEKAPRPGLILIHGGGWAGGKKEDFDDLAKRFAKAGFVSATIDYRLAPKSLFPAQIEDSKCAVRWMRAHAEELGVDPTRIGAIGGSAGGHLALMLGALDPADGLEGEGGWPDQSSKVQAVVNFVGPGNLVGEFPDVSDGILDNFLGGPQADKLDDYRRASPISYINEGDAPMLMFFGTKDVLVPFDQAFQLTSALEKANVVGRVEILLGEGHGWGGAKMERTLDASIAFLHEHLRPAD